MTRRDERSVVASIKRQSTQEKFYRVITGEEDPMLDETWESIPQVYEKIAREFFLQATGQTSDAQYQLLVQAASKIWQEYLVKNNVQVPSSLMTTRKVVPPPQQEEEIEPVRERPASTGRASRFDQ